MEGGCATAPQENTAVIRRRFPRIALAAAIVAAAVVAATVALSARNHGGAVAAYLPGPWCRQGPRALVRQPLTDLGVIETPEQLLAHTFLIDNQGDTPLELAPGPSTCKCTVTELPKTPIPPGGRDEVRVAFSAATKRDTLKAGPFSRSVIVLSNDPAHGQIMLTIGATARCRLAVAPSPITLAIDSADLPTAEKRSAETLIYSQTWRRFELAALRSSRKGMTWRRPAGDGQATRTFPGPRRLPGLRHFAGRHARRPLCGIGGVCRHFARRRGADPIPRQCKSRAASTAGFASSAARSTTTASCDWVPCKRGRASETLLMKIRDPCPGLVVRRLETEPTFLHVRVNACRRPGRRSDCIASRWKSRRRRRRATSWATAPQSSVSRPITPGCRGSSGRSISSRWQGRGSQAEAESGRGKESRKRAAPAFSSFILHP